MAEQLERAKQRMAEAKRKFSDACKAVLDGDPQGPLLSRIALSQVEEARAALRRLSEEDVP